MSFGTQIVDLTAPVFIFGLSPAPIEDAVRSFDDTRREALIAAAKRFDSLDDEDDEDNDEDDEDDDFGDDEEDDDEEDEDDEYEDEEDEDEEDEDEDDEDEGEEISLI
jgi:hypothetical protein